MSLIIETGGGVRYANAYASVAFVTNYLTNLNKNTGWDAATTAVQEGAIIAATSYIDTRWGPSFLGSKLVAFSGVSARGELSFVANVQAGDILTLGSITYTFVTSVSDLSQFEIEVGASQKESLETIVSVINNGQNVTPANIEASAGLKEDSEDILIFQAALAGTSGNDIALAATIANGAGVRPFSTGLDYGSQPLEFPRNYLTDPAGQAVVGIPLKLKQAMAEYADRARDEELYQDPVIDETGRALSMKREKIGPIEEEVRYEAGGGVSPITRDYPSADQLLSEYRLPAGSVNRG